MTGAATSHAAVFHGPDEPLSIEEFRLPVLSAGEALVRIECCTLCGSDLHSIAGHRSVAVPTVLGHEIIGHISQVSDELPPTDVSGRQLNVGDRVVWSVVASCGTCDRCLRNLPQKCRRLFKYGHEVINETHPLSGGLAEYCHLARGTAIVRIDESFAASEIAPVSCATATVAEAVRCCTGIEGRRVLIFGAGMLGLTAAAMSSLAGAASVTVCDIDTERLHHAEQFGATDTIEWSSLSATSVEADIAFELSGATPAVEAAVNQLGVGGELILVGSVSPAPAAAMDPERIVRRLLRIQGVHNYTPEALLDAVEFLSQAQAQFPFDQLVEETFSLREINAAVEYARESRACRVAVQSSSAIDTL